MAEGPTEKNSAIVVKFLRLTKIANIKNYYLHFMYAILCLFS